MSGMTLHRPIVAAEFTALEWWERQGVSLDPEDTEVRRLAHTDDQYEMPESDVYNKSRGSRVGRYATIPKANNDGTSRGFNAGVAGCVHVDPGYPDSVIFDPRAVTAQMLKQAAQTSRYPHQAMQQLGYSVSQLQALKLQKDAAAAGNPSALAIMPPSNPYVGSGYVTPSAQQDGRQVTYAMPSYPMPQESSVQPLSSLPPLPAAAVAPPIVQQMQPTQVQPMLQAAPAPVQQHYPPQAQYPPQQAPYPPQAQYPPQAYYPPQNFAPPGPPQPDPMLAHLLNAVTALGNRFQAIEQAQFQPLPVTTGVSPNMPVGMPLRTIPPEMASGPDSEARPLHSRRDTGVPTERSLVRQTTADYEQHQRGQQPPDAVGAIIAGFETLNLPFVSGPVPDKPRRQVYFKIPNGGTHAARFHDVVESKTSIVLVYDTRYEEGNQFVPPTLPNVTIELQMQDKKKVVYVHSLDLTFAFGCFDMVVLLKVDEPEVQ